MSEDNFLQRLRQAKQDAADKAQAERRAELSSAQREQQRDELVDDVALQLEVHIEQCLKEFNEEFVEFKYEAFTENGRNFRVHWNEPGRGSEHFFHQLSFRVRRYHEYADVEVESKMIIRNSERRRRTREEDVFDGEPDQLLRFVEQQICEYARLYTEARGW
ncbi:MAG: hypothetical protein GC159_04460 [Phycisphaera sp.]|nr:hypothetical protein [Phycisphaera sp.]